MYIYIYIYNIVLCVQARGKLYDVLVDRNGELRVGQFRVDKRESIGRLLPTGVCAVRACVCVRACACVCVRVCEREGGRESIGRLLPTGMGAVRARACVCACVRVCVEENIGPRLS
jgi:hypothetical protein